MKRVAFALLVGLLALGTAFYFRHSLITAVIPNPKLSPEVVALNRQFPLYAVSRGPLMSPRHVEAPAAATQAAKDLRAYYADDKQEPAWKAAVRRLSAVDPAECAQAASYLRDLLDQALKDEQAGIAPWLASPFWGNGGTNPARGLRERVAAALAATLPAPGAVPVVRWFLEHEKLSRLQGEVLNAVTGLQGPEADALLWELATTPHPNAEVALTALTQAGERKVKVTAEQLASLCQHHRTKLREAALALNAQLGYPAPPPFDAARAVQSEPIRRLMDEIGRLLAEPVPAEAPFVRLTVEDAGPNTFTARGWLLGEDEGQWVVLTAHGRRQSFPKEGEHKATLVPVPIQEEVDRVVALRREGDPKFEMSSRGGFSGQFQGHGAGEYEALLARWLHAGRRYELAASILLPALDTLILDSHLVDITRDRLGDGYAQEMLAAFVGDRDYAKVERVAKWLAERFPGTRFHAVAVRLLDELPGRRDDFAELRLPSPKEWAAEKAKRSRREQIDYLCSRLRLLNCFQDGQPGGAWYGEAQYAEPCGINPDASWGRRQGKTEVINPLVELAGPIPGGGDLIRAARSDGLGLTVADLPALAAHLREDWFFPTVSFWRDFSADRTLHQTRPLLASLINRIARQPLCRAEKLDAMTEKERDEEIARITRWADANRAKDDTALLLGALEDALKAGTRWSQVSTQTSILAERKVEATVPLVFQFVEAGLTEPFCLRDVRALCDKIDPEMLQELTRKGLKHEDQKIRMRVALLALPTAKRAAALALLGDGLENGADLLDVTTISALFDEKTPDSRATAARVFKNRRLPEIDGRARFLIVHSATNAGVADGLRLYLRLLDMPGNTIGKKTYDRPVAEVAAEEAFDLFTSQDRVADKIKKKPAPPEEKIAALKALLKEKIENTERPK
jgi:hypothetical protein